METSKRKPPVQPVQHRIDLPPGLARNPALVRFLFTYRRGLVVYEPSRVKLADLLVEIVQHVNQRPLAIACGGLGDAGRITRALVEAGLTQIQLVARDIWENQNATVVVGTPEGIETAMSTVGEPGCLLVADARLILHQRIVRIAQASRRRFSFVPVNKPMMPAERARMKRRLGTAELHLPAPGMVQRGVTVTWLQSNFAPGSPDLKLPALKRQAIWRHAGRNRLVARTARQVVAGTLASEGSGDDGLVGRTDVPRTIVVVENAEHAATLQQQNLDWPIVCLRRSDRSGLPGEINLVQISEGHHEVVGPAIVTLAALPHLEGADAIVRADAGTGPLPLSPDLLGRPFDGSRDLQLIDFADRGHPVLRQRAKRRKQAYESDVRFRGTPFF